MNHKLKGGPRNDEGEAIPEGHDRAAGGRGAVLQPAEALRLLLHRRASAQEIGEGAFTRRTKGMMPKWSELLDTMTEEEAYTYIVERELLQEHVSGFDNQHGEPCKCPYCPRVRLSSEVKGPKE